MIYRRHLTGGVHVPCDSPFLSIEEASRTLRAQSRFRVVGHGPIQPRLCADGTVTNALAANDDVKTGSACRPRSGPISSLPSKRPAACSVGAGPPAPGLSVTRGPSTPRGNAGPPRHSNDHWSDRSRKPLTIELLSRSTRVSNRRWGRPTARHVSKYAVIYACEGERTNRSRSGPVPDRGRSGLDDAGHLRGPASSRPLQPRSGTGPERDLFVRSPSQA